MYTVSMDFLREAENHCILQSPIPITCPVRLIHGLKDEDVPWHISMQVAERVLSPDVDIILRRHGQHRMADKDDIKLIVYTIDDLIDKLTTLVWSTVQDKVNKLRNGLLNYAKRPPPILSRKSRMWLKNVGGKWDSCKNPRLLSFTCLLDAICAIQTFAEVSVLLTVIVISQRDLTFKEIKPLYVDTTVSDLIQCSFTPVIFKELAACVLFN